MKSAALVMMTSRWADLSPFSQTVQVRERTGKAELPVFLFRDWKQFLSLKHLISNFPHVLKSWFMPSHTKPFHLDETCLEEFSLRMDSEQFWMMVLGLGSDLNNQSLPDTGHETLNRLCCHGMAP